MEWRLQYGVRKTKVNHKDTQTSILEDLENLLAFYSQLVRSGFTEHTCFIRLLAYLSMKRLVPWRRASIGINGLMQALKERLHCFHPSTLTLSSVCFPFSKPPTLLPSSLSADDLPHHSVWIQKQSGESIHTHLPPPHLQSSALVPPFLVPRTSVCVLPSLLHEHTTTLGFFLILSRVIISLKHHAHQHTNCDLLLPWKSKKVLSWLHIHLWLLPRSSLSL